jgi:hypothetical protein
MHPLYAFALLHILIAPLVFSIKRDVPLSFALPCTTSTTTPLHLLQKPVYPPVGCDSVVGEPVVGQVKLSKHPELHNDLLQSTCSCEDVHGLQRKLFMCEQEQRVLARKIMLLESITRDMVQTLQTSDDIALLERRTCSAVVYNEQLTEKRPLRLLRHELKTLQGKYSL